MRRYRQRRQFANARLLLPVSRLYRQRDTLLNHTQTYNISQGKCLIHLKYKINLKELFRNYYHVLQHYREIKGISRSDLGKMTGIKVGVIQNYESKRSELYYENARLFADVLNIDVDLLLDDYTRFTSPGFGDKIKSIRHQMGLSQSRFATVLGVTRSTVSIWEIEYHRPSRAACQRLIPMWKERLGMK